MTVLQLSNELRRMYEKGSKNKEQSTMIHLFGIKYANTIIENRYSIKEILKYAEMYESYHTEIRKGMNLAKYVQILSER